MPRGASGEVTGCHTSALHMAGESYDYVICHMSDATPLQTPHRGPLFSLQYRPSPLYRLNYLT